MSDSQVGYRFTLRHAHTHSHTPLAGTTFRLITLVANTRGALGPSPNGSSAPALWIAELLTHSDKLWLTHACTYTHVSIMVVFWQLRIL